MSILFYEVCHPIMQRTLLAPVSRLPPSAERLVFSALRLALTFHWLMGGAGSEARGPEAGALAGVLSPV